MRPWMGTVTCSICSSALRTVTMKLVNVVLAHASRAEQRTVVVAIGKTPRGPQEIVELVIKIRMAANEYLSHYHAERHHQGLGGSLINADETAGATTGRVASRARIGGMLNHYYRQAA